MTYKCQLYLPSGELLTVDLDGEFRIFPDFRVWELANKQAKEEIKLVIPDDRAWKLGNMMQNTRNAFGRMDINSFFRTKSFNASIGGDPNSAHLYSWAFDVDWDVTTEQDNRWIEWWRRSCELAHEVGAIGLYDWGYHCEIGSDILFKQKVFKVRNFR